jgi:Rieske Fe-S protein
MTPPKGEEPLPDATPVAATGSPPRREFLKVAACAALGGCALAAPIGAAVYVLANPLRSRGNPLPVRITTVAALPVNGPPKFFQVVTERRDAWTKFPARAIGAVFLRRTGENEVLAFNAACPHLGCAVEYRAARTAFYCPCHNSEFATTGVVRGKSPSRRGLDTLRAEIRDEGEVWVYFESFKAGVAEKVSLA